MLGRKNTINLRQRDDYLVATLEQMEANTKTKKYVGLQTVSEHENMKLIL